jgi:hypothetical protein
MSSEAARPKVQRAKVSLSHLLCLCLCLALSPSLSRSVTVSVSLSRAVAVCVSCVSLCLCLCLCVCVCLTVSLSLAEPGPATRGGLPRCRGGSPCTPTPAAGTCLSHRPTIRSTTTQWCVARMIVRLTPSSEFASPNGTPNLDSQRGTPPMGPPPKRDCHRGPLEGTPRWDPRPDGNAAAAPYTPLLGPYSRTIPRVLWWS